MCGRYSVAQCGAQLLQAKRVRGKESSSDDHEAGQGSSVRVALVRGGA